MPKIARPPHPDEAGLFIPSSTVLIAWADRDGNHLLLPVNDQGYYGRYPTIVGWSVRRHLAALYQGVYDTRSFTVNVPDLRLEQAVRRCQRDMGRRDSFQRAGLTAIPAQLVRAPMVEECFVNLECELRHSLPVGECEFIVGEVVMAHLDAEYNLENGNIRWGRYPTAQRREGVSVNG